MLTTWLTDKASSLFILLCSPLIILLLGGFYLYDKFTGKDTAL